MTHDPSHAIFFAVGILYFVLGGYFSLRNYQMTKHEGFWFFLLLFSISMTGMAVAGTLWSAELADPHSIQADYYSFFLMASIFLFTATYTIHKKHHKIKVF